MLRRTVGRGFGAVGGLREGEFPPPPPETRRHAAMSRLFVELQRLLSEGLEPPPPGGAGSPETAGAERAAGDDGPAAGEDAGRPAREVTEPRSFSRGVEFRLVGPAASLSFLNDLRGLVCVSRLASGGAVPGSGEGGDPPAAGLPAQLFAEAVTFEVISLHYRARGYQPIRKTFPSGTEWPPADGRRCAFEYTTLRGLAARYLALAGVSARRRGGGEEEQRGSEGAEGGG